MGNKLKELEATVNQKNWCRLLTWQYGGLTGTAGLLHWMAMNSSKGTGKEGEAVGWPHMLGSFDGLELVMVMAGVSVPG